MQSKQHLRILNLSEFRETRKLIHFNEFGQNLLNVFTLVLGRKCTFLRFMCATFVTCVLIQFTVSPNYIGEEDDDGNGKTIYIYGFFVEEQNAFVFFLYSW